MAAPQPVQRQDFLFPPEASRPRYSKAGGRKYLLAGLSPPDRLACRSRLVSMEEVSRTYRSGNDSTVAALMLLGARGTISVTANIIPRVMSQLCAAARSGDVIAVREISRRIAPLHRAMFPVKWVLECLGLIEAHYRLPLTSLGVIWHDEIDAALRDAAWNRFPRSYLIFSDEEAIAEGLVPLCLGAGSGRLGVIRRRFHGDAEAELTPMEHMRGCIRLLKFLISCTAFQIIRIRNDYERAIGLRCGAFLVRL